MVDEIIILEKWSTERKGCNLEYKAIRFFKINNSRLDTKCVLILTINEHSLLTL